MMKCKLLLLALMVVSTGCTDDVNSLTREYRAATNEAIDALMMITSEQAAERMTMRVLKPLSNRYTAIDKKLTIVKDNRGKKDFVKEVLESDEVQIYLTDLQVNKERLDLELARLKNLYKAEIKDGACPKLDDLVNKDSVLDPLKKHLKDSELEKYLKAFPTYKVGNYDELLAKFTERRKTFEPQRKIRLR